ncbi:ATP-dependent DNA helicase [Thalassobacillus pellis]|uniref:ATP-dependent DNA helicase n=1 Tax=Thalassobacillus pellis TaxID=748008 RepID=UPI0019605A0E|nr:ATP-dependent DNA helicase [Thalassobacillus pellis]MBM7551935.1 Rad3-related DNA helicase [Thalassobacillus pellis]
MAHMKISVRSLAEYVYRAGNIDNRFRTSSSLTEGTAIHQMIQKKYKDEDEKEVFLKTDFHVEGLTLTVHGRCDGLLKTPGGVMIDEIKSTSQQLDEIQIDSSPVHWAQAKGYAYIYAYDNQLEEINVQLTYVQKETKEKQKFLRKFTLSELAVFMEKMVNDYVSFGNVLVRMKEEKSTSLNGLDFPYESYRAGQRKLAGSVYKTITEKKDLYAQAPTGIGKTISTLFPAVKAMDDTETERIFYLTAKTITRMTAEEALGLLERQGLRMRSVTLTAKDKICFKEETICQPEYCEFAEGYYDRVNGAMIYILSNETQMTRSVVERYARKHRICPFEFSLDLAYQVDAVICDYNYIFDPRVSLKRLLQEDRKNTVLLVDEAHNLVERSREMYSAEISQAPFADLKKRYEDSVDIHAAAIRLEEELTAIKNQFKGAESFELVEMPGTLEEAVDYFITKAEKELQQEEKVEEDGNDLLLETYFAAQNFMKIIQLIDDTHVVYGETVNGYIRIKIFCVDPSHLLKQVSKNYRTAVYFSATLSPFAYYKDMLGGEKEDYILQLPSPYVNEQMEVTIHPISTRYKDRERTSSELARILYEHVQMMKGNYLLFFPSYHYMELVYQEWIKVKGNNNFHTIIQSRDMSEEEKDDFLASFQPDSELPLIGFAVLGGVFSEGVDLRGDRLNGVAVIGIGLAPRSFERDLIKRYFNQIGKGGYDYAYVYPGMNKVLQAGGRLIRSEKDYGKIMLIDDRFLNRQYKRLLPDEWNHYNVVPYK